jgi:hypothetical protein
VDVKGNKLVNINFNSKLADGKIFNKELAVKQEPHLIVKLVMVEVLSYNISS